jgi:hypothetical protein
MATYEIRLMEGVATQLTAIHEAGTDAWRETLRIQFLTAELGNLALGANDMVRALCLPTIREARCGSGPKPIPSDLELDGDLSQAAELANFVYTAQPADSPERRYLYGYAINPNNGAITYERHSRVSDGDPRPSFLQVHLGLSSGGRSPITYPPDHDKAGKPIVATHVTLLATTDTPGMQVSGLDYNPNTFAAFMERDIVRDMRAIGDPSRSPVGATEPNVFLDTVLHAAFAVR